MRRILTISLPDELVSKIDLEIQNGKFSTRSEFIRHLVRLWDPKKAEIELYKSKFLRRKDALIKEVLRTKLDLKDD